MPADLARLDFVDVTPNPEFFRFNGPHERVLRAMEMLRSVLVLGGVAASDVPAFQAQTKMDPGVPHLHAFFTHMHVRRGELDVIQMRTLGSHRILRLSSAYARSV
jgi:hypothetical protein